MADDLVIGGQLGSYLIESVIGRGGMSVVYRARHSRLGTSVALKVLAPELSSDDTYRERFLREAQMAAGIDHPNVVPIHDLGLHDKSLYIVMRYVAGGDLKKLLASFGPLPPERALEVLRPAALALDAAHAHGLVHRDVKPGNILIQPSAAGDIEHVYLTDFGVAKSSSITGLTRAGGMIGTVGYMAPEQMEGRPVSAQTDVYALAEVLYECLTGRLPFERRPAETTVEGRGSLIPLSELRPDLPRGLDGVFEKALAHDPGDRYASCEELVHACEEVVLGAGAPGVEPARASEAGPAALATPAPAPGERPAQATPAPAVAGPSQEQAHAQSETPAPQPAGQIASAGPTPGADAAPPPSRDGARRRPWRQRPLLYAAALVVAAGAVVAGVLASSSSTGNGGRLSSAALGQVPTNHVTGAGSASVRLKGDVAAVTITTQGLDYNDAGMAHAMHIHAGGKGLCPPASAARPHNGHLTISTTDGILYYGPPAEALTTHGDTSPASILAFSRYPTGGAISYTRRIALPANVLTAIRENKAVIVIHGIDYDHSGIYSGVLDRSELNKSVPGTATAPALCGTLLLAQSATAQTGSGGAGPLYTASLTEQAGAPAGAGLFFCDAGDAGAPAAAPRRRRTGTGAAA